MTTTTEITAVAPVVTTIGSGHTAIASCLFGAGSPSFAFALRGTGVFTDKRDLGGVSERPTGAPVAQAAQIFGYAAAADGAGHRELLAGEAKAAANQQLSKMWAFRGLEPWRDPA